MYTKAGIIEDINELVSKLLKYLLYCGVATLKLKNKPAHSFVKIDNT